MGSSLAFDRPAEKPKAKRGRKPSNLPVGIDRLTTSQKALLDLLCDGYGQKEAAFMRGLTYESAKMYLKNARHATGCRTTLSMAVQYRVQKPLI